MENELITGINNYISSKNLLCSRLKEEDARALIEKLAKVYGFNLSNLYLWESNGIDIEKRVSYDNTDEEWEEFFTILLQSFGDKIYLVVTDDEFYPWIVFECEKKVIANLIMEQQYFEFFIFDISMKQILFDTHGNEFILVQQLYDY